MALEAESIAPETVSWTEPTTPLPWFWVSSVPERVESESFWEVDLESPVTLS